jgi:hypothetical protein
MADESSDEAETQGIGRRQGSRPEGEHRVMSEVMRRIAFGSEGNVLQDPSCCRSCVATAVHQSVVTRS